MLNNVRTKEIDGAIYYIARDVFKAFNLSYKGEISILKKNILKEWIVFSECDSTKNGTRYVFYINEMAVHRLSAFGSNQTAMDYFIKNKK